MTVHLLWLVLVTLVVVTRSQDAECTLQGYQLMTAKFGKEVYKLCLKLVNIGQISLASESAAILLDPDTADTDNSLQGFPLQELTMAYGYPVHALHSGSAEGYIGEDNHFYGVLHIGHRTLYADPYGKDDISREFGAFESGYGEHNMFNMARPRRHQNQLQAQYEDTFNEYFPYRITGNKHSVNSAHARICDLLLLADKEFYVKDANSSLNQAVRRMVHAVAQADIIFRNADFNEDGTPDNIGFTVKYILVLTSTETNQRVFGNMLSSTIIDGREYLMKLARLRRLSEVCLGVAFTGHAFHNRTLGLSFTSVGHSIGGATGGLCDRRAFGRSFNTIALAHMTEDGWERVPERIVALTLAHEIGHSFGAHHDDNFPNPECRGFLMGSESTTTANSRHFEFSVCSKRMIAAKLNSMSYCLQESHRPYCGNGIVEEGEACDCGIPSRCHKNDHCCTPRAGGALVYEESTLHVEGCSVAPDAVCHPSQGICCTAQCELTDLSDSGIDCSTLDKKCTCESTEQCTCALGGRCLPDRTCHAAECAKLGLRECQCRKKGVVSAVSEASRCGVCCEMKVKNGEDEACVGAEIAAVRLMDSGYVIPSDWPDPEYQGPNVTLQFLRNGTYSSVALRAWPAGGPCVTQGVVGLCSMRGVCEPRYRTPRSNVYPTIMCKLKQRTSRANVYPTVVKMTGYTQGFVGLCSLKGVCKPKYGTPRSNVYPTIMARQMPERIRQFIATTRKSRSIQLKPKLNSVLVFTFVIECVRK